MRSDLDRSTEPKLVRVRRFTGPTAQLDADLARNILDAAGIPCVVPGGVMADVLPGIDGAQLLVREDDAEEAREILRSYLDGPGDAS